jgi:hypothetical protein
MSDPPRLLEANGLAGSLLRAGAEEMPSRAAVRKAALAIGAGAAIASSSAAASGAGMATGTAGSLFSKASAPFTLAALGKWVGIGTLTGLVTVTSATQVERLRTHAVVALAPTPRSTISTERSPFVPRPSVTPAAIDVPAPPDVEIAVAPPSNEPLPPVQQVPPRAKIGERVSETPAPDKPANTLPPAFPRLAAADDGSPAFAPEIAFVDRAWQAMQRGSYENALGELVPYEGRFPDLRLHPEVLFLRMEAERQLGHAASAVSLARQIISLYPKSAQAARARSILSAR